MNGDIVADFTTIAVDVMGGDYAPGVVVEGIKEALSVDPTLEIIAVGEKDVVESLAASHTRCTAHPTTEVIAMNEHPAKAVMAKKDSSIVVGCRLVKEGEAEGFFSAGSTGAVLAAATLVMGRAKGVKRPAIAQILPGYQKPTLFLDIGANAECTVENLVQFAVMGGIYMNKLMDVKSPRIGLLNIGEEDTKGTKFAQDVHKAMKERVDGFAGNAEGRDLLSGSFDVIVTDGFTGNVSLKTIEGTTSAMFRYVKDVLMGSLRSKMGAALIARDFAELKDRLSPDTYGGSPLLGVKGSCVIGHGSSNVRAVKNGIAVAATTARSEVSRIIAEAM